MKHQPLWIALLLLSFVPGVTSAGHSWSLWNKGNQAKDSNANYSQRFPYFEDDITPDQDIEKIKLTDEQKHEAKVWSLTERQEKRYLLLQKNKSGLYYKAKVKAGDLTPVEVLGLNARTDAERQRFAAKSAYQNAVRLAKELALAAAYHDAAVQLKERNKLPVIRAFDTSPYSPYNHQPVALQKNDVLMLFVKTEDRVRSITAYLMGRIQSDPTIRLNVYFVGEGLSAESIRTWAKGQSIPAEMVEKRLITLNKDDGRYKRLSRGHKTPALVLVRNSNSKLVSLSGF